MPNGVSEGRVATIGVSSKTMSPSALSLLVSGVLVPQIEQVEGVSFVTASGTVTNQVTGAAAASLPLHQAVVHAIAQHDAEAARGAMRDLVDQAAVDIDQAIRAGSGTKTA